MIIDANKAVEIRYDFIAENFVRKRDKAFSNKEKENSMIYIYDNFKLNNTINNLSLTINIQNKIDLENMKAYPEKYQVNILINL